jgi:hypothetical protein
MASKYTNLCPVCNFSDISSVKYVWKDDGITVEYSCKACIDASDFDNVNNPSKCYCDRCGTSSKQATLFVSQFYPYLRYSCTGCDDENNDYEEQSDYNDDSDDYDDENDCQKYGGTDMTEKCKVCKKLGVEYFPSKYGMIDSDGLCSYCQSKYEASKCEDDDYSHDFDNHEPPVCASCEDNGGWSKKCRHHGSESYRM